MLYNNIPNNQNQQMGLLMQNNVGQPMNDINAYNNMMNQNMNQQFLHHNNSNLMAMSINQPQPLPNPSFTPIQNQQNKPAYSCVYCEDIYKMTILNNLPLKSLKCLYCGNVTNESSLEFYMGKYKDELVKAKKNNIGVKEEPKDEPVEKKKEKKKSSKKNSKKKNKYIKIKDETTEEEKSDIEEEEEEEESNSEPEENAKAKTKEKKSANKKAKNKEKRKKEEKKEEPDFEEEVKTSKKNNQNLDTEELERKNREIEIQKRLDEMKKKTQVKPEAEEADVDGTTGKGAEVGDDQTYENFMKTKQRKGIKTGIGREKEYLAHKNIISVKILLNLF
jgi:hypothetical protein